MNGSSIEDFELDARGVLRVSNSKCDRERSLLLAGFDPDDIAVRHFGARREAFQSPLAIALGNQFESGLYANNAERLVKAYVEAKRLKADAVVVDLTNDIDRVRKTLGYVTAKGAGDEAPDIIIQGGLTLEAFGAPASVIRPDILVAERGKGGEPLPFYRPGEVKSYESREGYTSEEDIGSSAAQAAVALLALAFLDERYVPATPFVDIVLRRPSGMFPIIHPIPAARDLHRLRIAAKEDHGFVQALLRLHNVKEDSAAFKSEVSRIPTRYEPTCLQRCGFARECRAEARGAGEPGAIDAGAAALLPGNLDLLLKPEQLGDTYEANMLRAALLAIDEALEAEP